MEDLKYAVNTHLNQMSDILEKLTTEFRSGFQPACDNFIGFFHAIDWKEPWLMCLIFFHVSLVATTFISWKNVNFQMVLFAMALIGVYLAETINGVLANNWKKFAGQNYFDPHGLFLSVLWSGPLLLISIIILINTLFSLCYLIVKWKRAELRHRANLSVTKQD